MELESLYQDIILDHYKKPRGRGLREPFEAQVRHVNPTCGDEVDLRVHLVDGTVADVSYEGMGCSISQASTSVLHELLVGRTVTEALSTVEHFTEMVGSRGQIVPDEELLEDAVAFAGVAKFPARVKCALLAWMAFKDATAQAVASTSASTSASAAAAASAAGPGPASGSAAASASGSASAEGLDERG